MPILKTVAFALAVFMTQGSLAKGNFEQEFLKSRATWDLLNVRHDLIYRFTVKNKSWVGLGQTTRIDVSRDAVVQREFDRFRWYYDYEDNNTYKEEILESWGEKGSAIGQHAEGERAKNLQTVYDECRENILSRDAKQFTIEFNVDQAGLIRTCRARDIYCADDCWEGIDIQEIKMKEIRVKFSVVDSYSHMPMDWQSGWNTIDIYAISPSGEYIRPAEDVREGNVFAFAQPGLYTFAGRGAYVCGLTTKKIEITAETKEIELLGWCE